jgi:hypothetical protein
MRLSWGKKTYDLLKASLRRLRKVPITWEWSFYDKTIRKLRRFEEPLNILGKLQFREVLRRDPGGSRRQTADPGGDASCFRFNEYIERNLMYRHTKPIFFEVAMRLRGEIALGLYAFLDVILPDKLTWERRATELLRDDLTVRGTYSRPAERRRLLMRAVNELQGKPISTGILKLSVVKARDNGDYKLVVRKTPFKPRRPPPKPDPRRDNLVEEILAVAGDEHSRPYYAKLVRELPEHVVWELISETRQAKLEGRIKTTPARFFTDLAQRHLGHKPREGEGLTPPA